MTSSQDKAGGVREQMPDPRGGPWRPRLRMLLPLVLIGALLAGPIIIWLMQDNKPIFEQMEMLGSVVAVEPAKDGAAGGARITIRIDNSTQTLVVSGSPDIEPGTKVTILRTVKPDGTSHYALN
ncbi:MAG: hypothetical protein RIB97_21215 [Nitratireductor sp.]